MRRDGHTDNACYCMRVTAQVLRRGLVVYSIGDAVPIAGPPLGAVASSMPGLEFCSIRDAHMTGKQLHGLAPL
jgi:hypothetical protein